MSSYDPNSHQQMADVLLKRAGRIVWVFTFIAAIFGAGIGLYLVWILGSPTPLRFIGLWAAILAAFGFVSGKERKFSFQMKAQELLWQRQMEENSRPEVKASAAAAK